MNNKIHFDNLPTDRPTGNTLQPGHYVADITDATVGTSKSSGNPMLTVTFKANGVFLRDFFVANDSPFAMYKLGLLVNAAGGLEGSGTLEDVAKIVVKKRVEIDVKINDRGYPTISFDDGAAGISPHESEASPVTTVQVEADDDF